ncbi:hypothetical protein, partial [Mycolicibacterium pulveris]|uniref:hypothetical protein n=1 Tax=Mycolicibacterium pulveris TaxID=36813 RepID=UPI003CED469A
MTATDGPASEPLPAWALGVAGTAPSGAGGDGIGVPFTELPGGGGDGGQLGERNADSVTACT